MNIKKNLGWIIPVGIIVVLVMWAIGGYNGMVKMDEQVQNKWANVETQYQRRADLIPNLVSTVKGYAKHEQQTLEDVVKARSEATQVKVDAENLTPLWAFWKAASFSGVRFSASTFTCVASLRAFTTSSSVCCSCLAYPFTVLTRFGMRSALR